jgi:hypothetical protein
MQHSTFQLCPLQHSFASPSAKESPTTKTVNEKSIHLKKFFMGQTKTLFSQNSRNFTGYENFSTHNFTDNRRKKTLHKSQKAQQKWLQLQSSHPRKAYYM